MNEIITKCYQVYGIVQGVGFRPTVSRHAAAAHITGSVSNKGPYVEIYAQGPAENVAVFRSLLENEPPRRASILNIKEIPLKDEPEFDKFEIIESKKTKGEIFISPDIAICDDCKKEMYDPNNKRYLHPFINCTCCGPRLTILDSLPYDRERTSMKDFGMCPDCESEYHDPKTRRYDAQPVCCNKCGPEVYLIGRNERGRDAITYTRQVIKNGGIAAVKGIGGFHLCCDASDQEAVALLRQRKRRPMKPFAVMAKNMEAAARECEFTDAQARILDGHQKPILLLNKKPGGHVCEECAPENPKLGIMLPYAPLQLLLFDYDDGIDMPDVLVMTSANTSGAPICRSDEDAVHELSRLCDCMLSHNRAIRIRADDTVMDFYKDRPYMVRRSRGYAPLPVSVSADFKGQALGIGGELKNEFCIGINDLFYISPYVGDLEDIRTVKALKETEGRFETLLEAKPEAVCCDMHPVYNSSEAAHDMHLPVFEIQHHYAHVLSCMAENDHFEKAIGVSFDGTGYGTDGTIWGGEILLSDLNGFTREAHIKPFLQIGGDISAREGWRIALAIIYKAADNEEEALKTAKALNLCSEKEARVLITMAKNNINSVKSTSCGRLFDAAAAILGIRRVNTFEGEAATALMYKAMEFKGVCHGSDPELYEDEDGLILPADLLINKLVNLKTQQKTDADEYACEASACGSANPLDPGSFSCDGKIRTSYLAYYFHITLANMITKACIHIRNKTGINTACLTGGVFQNTLLLGMCEEKLENEGFTVLIHSLIPPNDGGISLGQAVYAMGHLNN